MRAIMAVTIVLWGLITLPAGAGRSYASQRVEPAVTELTEPEPAGRETVAPELAGEPAGAEAMQPESADEPKVDESAPPLVPKWRLSVVALAQNDSYRPMLGVYHRVGERYDLGLSIDSAVSFYDREPRSADYGNYADEAYDFTASSDLRRWNRINDRISWYWGGRMSGGYTYDESKSSNSSIRSKSTLHNRMAGMSFVIGADLELLHHLSVSVSFVPIQCKYQWNKRERLLVHEATEDTEETRSTITEEWDTFSVWTRPNSAAYLSLTF